MSNLDHFNKLKDHTSGLSESNFDHTHRQKAIFMKQFTWQLMCENFKKAFKINFLYLTRTLPRTSISSAHQHNFRAPVSHYIFPEEKTVSWSAHQRLTLDTGVTSLNTRVSFSSTACLSAHQLISRAHKSHTHTHKHTHKRTHTHSLKHRHFEHTNIYNKNLMVVKKDYRCHP